MIRDCIEYHREYKICKKLKSQFYNFYRDDYDVNCKDWKSDYDNCLIFKQVATDDSAVTGTLGKMLVSNPEGMHNFAIYITICPSVNAGSSRPIIEHELCRMRKRLMAARNNDVWEYRQSPPDFWAAPINKVATDFQIDRTNVTLEVRVPFLDHRFTSYYMSLPASDRLPRHGIEKHLLRSAFAGQALLPDEILWRPKEAFSDGVSSVKKSWHDVLQAHIAEHINDQDLEDSASKFPVNPPRSKEGLHYRRIFEKSYPGLGKLIPYYWMLRWTVTDDPSARTLKHYKQ